MKGEVLALYRYPIKSMQGEAVEQLALLVPGGIRGDRTSWTSVRYSWGVSQRSTV